MFNLTKYRYVFLAISLLIIIPGVISLMFKGLNVGIDFAGGSTISLRPQKYMTATQAKALISSLKLSDVSIEVGDDKSVTGNKTIWIRLNTRIDSNVQDTIKNTLKGKYPEVTVSYSNIPATKPFTLVTVTGFQNVPKVSDVQALLSKLPNTTDVSNTSGTVTPTATGTAKATGTSTPAATSTKTSSTPTPAVTATAKTTGTPTATTTPTTNPAANIAVSTTNVLQGTTTETLNIFTSSTFGNTDTPKLQAALLNGGIYTQLLSNSEVGPSVASETTRNSFLAVLAASIFILLYIWFSFRKVAKPWRYGTCAIIALLHDVLVVLGVFSILGWTLHIQIDALFITALLTVVGFSVHDTIVVFDRIRENMQRRTSESFEQIVNASLVQTMARSLNTSLTVLFTLSALTLFGGTSIRSFTLTLLIGIFSGTYSSIFNASMLLVIWEKGEMGLGRFKGDNDQRRVSGRREERELARTRG